MKHRTLQVTFTAIVGLVATMLSPATTWAVLLPCSEVCTYESSCGHGCLNNDNNVSNCGDFGRCRAECPAWVYSHRDYTGQIVALFIAGDQCSAGVEIYDVYRDACGGPDRRDCATYFQPVARELCYLHPGPSCS